MKWQTQINVEDDRRTWVYKNANWRLFRQILKDNIQINNKIENTQTLEDEIEKLTNNLQLARNTIATMQQKPQLNPLRIDSLGR